MSYPRSDTSSGPVIEESTCHAAGPVVVGPLPDMLRLLDDGDFLGCVI